MIENYRENDGRKGGVFDRVVWPVVCVCLLVLGLALGTTDSTVAAQEPTDPPVQVTVEVIIPTAVPTETPTPIPTVDPAVIQYSGPSNTVDWSVPNVVTWTTQDWDFGCPFSYNTEASGAVMVCIAYTQITGWSMIGLDIPFWPFTGALALVIVGRLVRR